MSEGTATLEFSAETKELGDKIANLTLKQAKELSDYLKETYHTEPAAGGAVVMAPAGGDAGGAPAAAGPTEVEVVLTGFGDDKVHVVDVVEDVTGASLVDARKLVESAPAKSKEKVSKEDAEKVKAELEAAGASVEVK